MLLSVLLLPELVQELGGAAAALVRSSEDLEDAEMETLRSRATHY